MGVSSLAMTLFEPTAADGLLAVRFAYSPIWETQAAVQALGDGRAGSHHEHWHPLVRERVSKIDLTPLLAVLPAGGFSPDFLTPPPRTPRPRLRDQLAEIRATPEEQVARELELCRETVTDERYGRLLSSFLTDPAGARDLLATRLHQSWVLLIAPFWVRIRMLLEREIEERSRMLARHGLGRVLGSFDPRIRWTTGGISCADRSGRSVRIDERGMVLMPSAFLWPNVAVVVDHPWLPTIAYPARGIAELWQAPSAPPDALVHLLGRTRALVLASLDRPISTTALAVLMELSPAGTSRHLLALRDAGLVSSTRRGHEVRYRRTELGAALLHGDMPRRLRRRVDR